MPITSPMIKPPPFSMPVSESDILVADELDDFRSLEYVNSLKNVSPVSYTHLTLPTIYSV